MKNKPIYRAAFPLLIALFISVVPAQQPQSRLAPSVEQLRKHVSYLASPHLEGRRTGSAGANDAAHYIAGEFSQMGLRPAFQNVRSPRNRAETRSNYRQKFPYVAGVKLGNSNELSFTSAGTVTSPKTGDDWMPVGFSTNARIDKLPAVFVGYGITASELKYDDYFGGRAAGKVAVAFSGTPDDESPHDQFARHKDERWKAVAARNAGAKALVLIVRADNFREAHLSRMRFDNSAGDAGIPIVAISRSAGAKLLGMENTDALTKAQQEMKSWVSGGGPAASCQEPCGIARNFNLSVTSPITINTDIVRQDVAAYNIVGILDGSDATLKNEAIVIGAHYDHLGLGGAGSLAEREGEVHHGADDNASGVAGILELARIFSSQRPKPKRTIVFIAFSGEEEGLLGSNYYVNHPVVPLANTVAMINLDMVGRLKNQSLVIGGVGTAQEWKPMIETANVVESTTVNLASATAHADSATTRQMPMVVGSNGQPVVSSDSRKQFLLTLNQDGFGPSDHSSFYAKQIPVLFFWTGTHSDYHKPSDTADKINYEDEARIISLVKRIVNSINSSDKRPTFTQAKSETTGRSTGFRVYLGTVPNYADASDGMLLDGIRDDSPAAKAGLKAGDKIVKLAGRDIRNVYDYTAALGEMKAGQEYEVEVLRGSDRLVLKLTPAARR